MSAKMNKATLMQKLYKEGKKARDTHAGRVQQACEKYVQTRGDKIVEGIAKLTDMPKKKKKTKDN